MESVFNKPLDEEVKDLTDILDAAVSSKIIESASKATHTLTIPSNSRHLIIGAAAASNNTFCVYCAASSNGAVTIIELGKGTNVTLTTSTNTLTCTLANNGGLQIADFAIVGSFISVGS